MSSSASPGPDESTDTSQLLALLDVFEVAVVDFTTLVRALDDAQWELPTDLAGWSVHDLVSHTAHLEAVLAGAAEETIEVPEGLAHVHSAMSTYTEAGVIARRERTRGELLGEIEDDVATRLTGTRTSPPTDASAVAPASFASSGWSWLTLLTNRPLDVWMHEQDLRRAIGRPGGLDSPPARHVVTAFTRSWPMVVAKRAGARPGQRVALELSDLPQRTVVVVDESGRAVSATEDAEPDVTLRMDTESYVVLCGGRRDPAEVAVEVEGDDPDLAARILGSMTLTP